MGRCAYNRPGFKEPYLIYALSGLMIVVQIAFSFSPEEWMRTVWHDLSFVPARYTETGKFTIFAMTSPFTHLFVHGDDWSYCIINTLFLLAFGLAAETNFGTRKMFILFIASGLSGALLQFAIDPRSTSTIVGCAGTVLGLYGAATAYQFRFGNIHESMKRFGVFGVPILGVLLTGIIALGFPYGNLYNDTWNTWQAGFGGFIGGFCLAQLPWFRPPRAA